METFVYLWQLLENAPRKEIKELRILSGREADRAKAQGMKVVREF